MEARSAFDRMLLEDVPVAPLPRENEDARVARQNREALKSWAGLGVPVPVIQ